MRIFFNLVVLLFITSCSNLEFTYNDDTNLINPLYEKTKVKNSGVDLSFIKSYVPMLFGKNKENKFTLIIDIEEKIVKRSVETNQAISNLRYELRFFYTLILNKKSCVTYNKEILSTFSILPKSAGYNYGTDASLERKYELAVTDNINRFIALVSNTDISKCQ